MPARRPSLWWCGEAWTRRRVPGPSVGRNAAFVSANALTARHEVIKSRRWCYPPPGLKLRNAITQVNRNMTGRGDEITLDEVERISIYAGALPHIGLRQQTLHALVGNSSCAQFAYKPCPTIEDRQNAFPLFGIEADDAPSDAQLLVARQCPDLIRCESV